MSFREMIDAMLSAHGAGIDPTSVLEQHGMGDLPADAFSSALLHFAERAPLDVADALAPVVTRFSPVPFEPDDLSPSPLDGVLDSVLGQGGDVFDVLNQVDLTAPPDHPGDSDPGDFDHDDGHPADVAEAGTRDLDDNDTPEANDGFGAGHDQPDSFDHGLDGDPDGFDAGSPVDDALDVFASFGHDDHLVPMDDTPDFDGTGADDYDDATPDEPLHEGLEDLASSMSDMNVEVDRLAHDPTLDHFDL